MDELIKEIHKVIDQYLQEEIGNKLTQFNAMGLRLILVSTIKKHFEAEAEKK